MDNYSYNSYAESGDSSPRSREIDFENPSAWEDSQNQPPPNFKVKFMCSYGGKIHPRPHDNQLSYVGGETKILAVDRSVKFAQLLSKLVSLCDSDTISFKYQLPGEDLDALISVTNDDDLEHMMHEYDRLYRISPKPARLRIFIFPSLSQNPSLSSSVRSFGSEEGKSEKERFVEALNSAPILNPSPQPVSPVAPIAQPPQIPAGNADFLFGLEKANAMAAVAQNPVIEDPVAVSGLDERMIGSDPIQKHIQDLQRLRLEEQQLSGNYRRRSEDSLSGGYEGEYYRGPEKITQVPVSSPAVPYYTEKQQIPVGAYPTGTDQQQVYMIPAQAGPYHTQMVRPMAGAPTQSYYTIQRLPSEYYRDQQQQQQQMQQQQQQLQVQQQQQLQVQQQQQQQMQQQQQQMQQQQQQMYNMMPQSMAAAPPSMQPQPQKAAGYPEGYGMVRPVTSVGVGMVGEAAYAQMAYDNMGRQVIYTTQGTVMGAPAAAQVQAAATVAQYQAMATAGLNQEGGGKVIAKATQPSL